MFSVPEQMRVPTTQAICSTGSITQRKRGFNSISIDDEGGFFLRVMPVLMRNELEGVGRGSSLKEGPGVDGARALAEKSKRPDHESR